MTFPGIFPMSFFKTATGGTTYVNSVQYININIASGSTSNTATISAVGSFAFILFNGFEASETLNTARSYARIELTNSTTVTAFRNTGTSGTVTVKCCVVDATSNLIVSVQSGTISIASGSTTGTATVTAPAAGKFALHCLGWISTQTTLSLSNIEPLLTISGTTVTATRQFSGNTEVVGFVLIEFAVGALAQDVQSFAKSWTSSATSSTQAITSVNANNTLILWAGSNGNSAGDESSIEQTAELTNSTTATLRVSNAGFIGCKYNFYVIEFASGVLNSAVKRGSTTLTGVTSNTSTIASVNTSKSAINFTRYIATSNSANINNVCGDVELTNGTTVTVSRNGNSGNITGNWEVAEFT